MFKKNKVLWFLLIITLLGSIAGISLRMANEAQNKSLVMTIDYREFDKVAAKANVNLDTLLEELKAKGLTRASVKEVSLRDLEFAGKVEVRPFAEVKASIMNENYRDFKVVLHQIGDIPVSPVNLTIITSDKDTIEFLEANFSRRYKDDEIVSFSLDDKHYFVINTEIAPPVKTKEEEFPQDVLIGFDTSLMDKLVADGFEIVLSPGNSTGTNLEYIDDYLPIIEDYNIRYVVINGEVSGAPDNIEKMAKLVSDNDLIIGLIEMPVQLGFLEQKGLKTLIEDTNYPVNRVYSTRNDEYLKNVDERYYRWVRGVVDRGIRIIHVVPFQNDKLSYSENLEDTVEVIGRFNDTIQTKGYSINNPINILSAKTPNAVHQLMVGLSLLLGFILYLAYLFKINRRYLLALLGLGLLGIAGLTIGLAADFSKLYALAAAILYPSLSSLLLLIYIRDNYEHGFFRQVFTSLFIILGINAIGMFTIVTSLADIRFIMNIEYFRGVKLAFLLPLLLFILNYLAVFSADEGLVKYLAKYFSKKPNYFILMLLGIGVIAVYYYIGRSGHTAGVSVSSLELRLREVLESIFTARPRFKEILIGYPSLLVLVYLYRKYRHELIALVFGLGVMMGSISMVNSFAHVFTAVTISFNRTVAGLIIGLIIAVLVLVGVMILEKIYKLLMAS
ncbi:MAG: hypothetical protein GX333_01755 [Syntrophomonadaceae bacterium]|nr:hypothetical protein [Syntrophomonadaceae bacterium]